MTNFYARIADTARRFPDRTAIEWIGAAGTLVTTYDALLDDAARISAWLAAAGGVGRGDRVAILAANDGRWVAAFTAILRMGAVAVPLDTGYSAAQVQTVLADSGARVLIAGDRYLDTAQAAAGLAGANRPRVIAIGSEDLHGTHARVPPEPADVQPADAAVILYTSGTTADPKGVVLTHANLDAERTAVLTIVHATENDVVLGVLPLFHALAEMANLWLPLSIGARVVFLETVSSTTLLQALQTTGTTIFACVPQFFYLIHQRVIGEIARRGLIARRVFRLLLGANVLCREHLGWNPGRLVFARVHRTLGPSIRLLITGGSRFDPDILRDLYGLGLNLYNGYGLTETSGAATIVRPGSRFTTSVGPPLPGVEVRIAPREGSGAGAADGDVVEDGEVLIRGPVIMREYFGRPDRTAEAIRDGWLYTGDLGRIDAEGRLHITGRKKEIIVLSSGKNLYPEEIEAHYRQSPFIKELCVLGLNRPGEPSAERLHAVIVPDDQVMRERGIVNLGEIIRFELEGLSVQLPAHKRILSYDLSLQPLARTTTGKLRRAEIERQARQRATEPAGERTLSPAETSWLSGRGRADDVEAIAAHVGRARVTPDANLELDLGLDSMERVELLTMIEARHGKRVAAEARARIFTVRELVDAVEAATETAAGETPPASEGLPWDVVLAEPPDPALVDRLTRSKLVRAAVIYVALRMAASVAGLLIGLRVAGRANVPAVGPLIIAPNHQTYLDGFFVAAALPFHAFRRVFFVGAAEYFQTPLMAWGARAVNIVPVDPDANLVNAMRAAATGLRLGKVLMLFPEGERSIDGELKPFRKGVAILAGHLDTPVVPVALDGFFPIWPRGRPFQWRALFGGRPQGAQLTFGQPVRLTPGDYAAGALELQARVADMIRDR